MGAAEKISRLAVGDPAIPEMVMTIYLLDEKGAADLARWEELPVRYQGLAWRIPPASFRWTESMS